MNILFHEHFPIQQETEDLNPHLWLFVTSNKKNKNIIENEFYIMIYDNFKDNIENELNKRANTWIQRLKNCELKSEVLEERDIILLIKSFTIPEFARTEGTDYGDNTVSI